MKKILLVVFIGISALCAFAATRPDDFRITRSINIAAPADVVFSHINDLHAWQAWSPWAKKDPKAQVSYAGPETGVDSSFHWAGNSDVGEGTMTIIESRPGQLVRFQLDFLKPFKATNNSEFVLNATQDGTTVSWSMYGKNNFISKVIGIFMDCKKMVAPDFEQGLLNLKSVAEGKKS
ncbi:MAG: SRPBCC family protein [Deltaproteobacteria bacterium]|nr:MAG: SRPBCC family protein [Deltaproteobacteria bacterium]